MFTCKCLELFSNFLVFDFLSLSFFKLSFNTLCRSKSFWLKMDGKKLLHSLRVGFIRKVRNSTQPNLLMRLVFIISRGLKWWDLWWRRKIFKKSKCSISISKKTKAITIQGRKSRIPGDKMTLPFQKVGWLGTFWLVVELPITVIFCQQIRNTFKAERPL